MCLACLWVMTYTSTAWCHPEGSPALLNGTWRVASRGQQSETGRLLLGSELVVEEDVGLLPRVVDPRVSDLDSGMPGQPSVRRAFAERRTSSPEKYLTSSGIEPLFSFSLLCTTKKESAAMFRANGVGKLTNKDRELGLGERCALVLGEVQELGLDVLLQLSDSVSKSSPRVVDLVLSRQTGQLLSPPRADAKDAQR